MGFEKQKMIFTELGETTAVSMKPSNKQGFLFINAYASYNGLQQNILERKNPGKRAQVDEEFLC